MATAFVSVVLGKLESLASAHVEQEFSLWAGVQSEAQNLKTTLRCIQAVLEDADTKQMHKSEVKVWMDELKDIMYETEDVLDDWKTTRVDDGTGIVKKVSIYLLSLCSCLQPMFCCLPGDNFRPVGVCYTARKIKAIRDRLDSLTRDKDQLGLIAIQTQEDDHRRFSTVSLVDLSEICGREVEKKTIMSWLTGESSQQVHVPVISIVGMGGLGKTTLASLIYNGDTITSTFKPRMWVCVSTPFDPERVFKEIIKRAGGSADSATSLEELHQSLCALIRGKQFLLVLDDVWSEDPKDWEHIKPSLNLGAPGSRIIVTTRNAGVANMMGSEHTYSLGQLPEDDGCSLFWKIASLGRSHAELHKFKDVGDEIAKRCKGLPLAIKAVASLVRLKRSIEDWRNVMESDVWGLKLVKKSMLPALLLSYYDLSPSLKQCFVYCAIFRKDSELKRDELVQLWMAQGYLGLDEDKELEIIGAEYFEDLVMRSFFQDVSKDYDGNVTCKMHDLVHDLAQGLTESECTTLDMGNIPSGISNIRHVYMNELHLENPSILKSRNLRSLFIKFHSDRPIRSELCNHLRYLRVLSFSCFSFESLPDEIGGLSHLRYIDLSYNRGLQKLPETMYNLPNLQTLKLCYCSSLRELPREIGKLSKLRHLEIKGSSLLNYFPQSIGKLRCLRSLDEFIVGPTGEGCGIGELRDFNRLRGILRIAGLEHVGGVDEAKQAELWKKRNLRLLELSFGIRDTVMNKDDVTTEEEATLEGLQPGVNLQKLVIWHYRGRAFPFWMSSLSKVVELELKECSNCIQLPAALGRLESLEILMIFNFESLKHIRFNAAAFGNRESTNLVLFPKLKELTLWKLPNWEGEIEETNGAASMRASSVMPGLMTLLINGCPKLKVVPNYLFSPSLSILYLQNCPQLTGTQPCLPPRLEELTLDGDVGVLSESLLPCIIAHHNNTTLYPQLKSVQIWSSPHSSLPQGLSEFTSLQKLVIYHCDYLDLKPEEDLRHFPMLQRLHIYDCPIIEERCSRENWRTILCHQIPYNIVINWEKV